MKVFHCRQGRYKILEIFTIKLLKLHTVFGLQEMNVKLLKLQVLGYNECRLQLLELQFSNCRKYSLSLLPHWIAVVHCILSTTAQTAVKLQWENGHSENLQKLQ